MQAIITAATGYRDTDLQLFLVSASRVCPRAKVFLIVFERDRARIERLRDQYPAIEPVYVRSKPKKGRKVYGWIARHFINEDYSACDPFWHRLGRHSLDITIERYFIALELVRIHRHSFDSVLLTDSRDVVLQHDPFTQAGRNAVSGMEEKTIGECSLNSSWLAMLYGTDVPARMSNRRIVCSGVTLGPTAQIESYLEEMCREMWKHLSKIALRHGTDQAVHNYLLYRAQIDLELTDNQSGLIASLHYEVPAHIQTDDSTGLVIVQGRQPAIVHQYDRHRDLVTFLRGQLVN
jgi:hypothetical protein